VKRFESIITVLLSLIPCWCTAQDKLAPSETDSIEISLLTCSPHDEVYSLYGHTALRIEDKRTGEDIAVNYGLFSFQKPYFILRFVFGLTDYEMGIEPFSAFCEQYRRDGRSVTQQTLNLSADEKETIIGALRMNYLPENRVYRYNYLYDNCTTRARDIITDNLRGKVIYGKQDTAFKGPSFRELIHSCNANHPWARFGNDILLGVKADMATDRKGYQFLPANTMKDFDNATLLYKDGTEKTLVKRKTAVVEPAMQTEEETGLFTPTVCAVILLFVTIAVTTAEIMTGKKFWGYDALLMAASGTAGIILSAMLFSQHPTVQLNFQILLLNPLPLFFIPRMIRRTRKNKKDRQYIMWTILIGLFFLGGLFQTYAEGMYILALSLLIRNIIRLKMPRIIKKERF